MTLALTHARIVTPFRIIENGTLLVDGRQISGIGPESEVRVPSGATVYDCSGMIVTPGFIDLLVHGGGGWGFADMSIEAVRNISEFFYRHGTTGLLAALYSKPEKEMVADAERIAQFIRSSPGTNVVGMHLEGPFINKDFHGAMKSEYLWQPDVRRWQALHKAGAGFIRLMTIAPELPGADEVMRQAARDGVVLSIGHSSADYNEVVKAIDNGAAHVTHMFNAMKPFHHRTPGLITAALLHNELKVELIADGIHVHPAVMRLIYKVKGDGGIILITDAIRASGMPEGDYTFMDQKISVKDRKAYLSDGTLAGSTLTMDRAVKNMVELAEVPLEDAVRMASLNGAKVLGVEHQKGILAVGKDADIVAMQQDFQVVLTIAGGEIKHSTLTPQ